MKIVGATGLSGL